MEELAHISAEILFKFFFKLICVDLKQNDRIGYETGAQNQLTTLLKTHKKDKEKRIKFHTPVEVCPITEKIAPGVHNGTSA